MGDVNDTIRRDQADDTLVVAGTAGGSTTLEPWQRRVKASLPASGTHTITLPNPKLCPGDFVDVDTTSGSGGTVTCVATGAANQVITVAAGNATFWSNREKWRVVSAKLS